MTSEGGGQLSRMVNVTLVDSTQTGSQRDSQDATCCFCLAMKVRTSELPWQHHSEPFRFHVSNIPV